MWRSRSSWETLAPEVKTVSGNAEKSRRQDPLDLGDHWIKEMRKRKNLLITLEFYYRQCWGLFLHGEAPR